MIEITNNLGLITISNDTLIIIIKTVVADIEKVKITSNIAEEAIAVLGLTNGPIKIADKNFRPEITIILSAEFNTQLAEKGKEIQTKVASVINKLTTVEVDTINIIFKSLHQEEI